MKNSRFNRLFAGTVLLAIFSLMMLAQFRLFAIDPYLELIFMVITLAIGIAGAITLIDDKTKNQQGHQLLELPVRPHIIFFSKWFVLSGIVNALVFWFMGFKEGAMFLNLPLSTKVSISIIAEIPVIWNLFLIPFAIGILAVFVREVVERFRKESIKDRRFKQVILFMIFIVLSIIVGGIIFLVLKMGDSPISPLEHVWVVALLNLIPLFLTYGLLEALDAKEEDEETLREKEERGEGKYFYSNEKAIIFGIILCSSIFTGIVLGSALTAIVAVVFCSIAFSLTKLAFKLIKGTIKKAKGSSLLKPKKLLLWFFEY